MKKILFLLMIFPMFVNAQFPNQTGKGNTNTEDYQIGAVGTGTGFRFRTNYADTAAANAAQFIKNIPDFVISVAGRLMKRNHAATKWEEVYSASWGLSGNANTNPSNNFIGTTDNQPVTFKINGTSVGLAATDGRLFWNYNISANGIQIGRPFGETTNMAIGGLSSSTGWVSGTGTTVYGNGAALFNTTGSSLTAMGANALRRNTTGSNNSAFGTNAGSFNTTDGNQIFIGNLGRTDYTGDTSNTPIWIKENSNGLLNRIKLSGYLHLNGQIILPALKQNSTASDKFWTLETGERFFTLRRDSTFDASNGSGAGLNLYLGRNAGNTTSSGGGNNVGIGDSALNSATTGWGLIAVGNLALKSNTTGLSNVAVGHTALRDNTTGSYNTGLGYALKFNTTGSYNTGIGNAALFYGTTAAENTAVGSHAGVNITTGYRNVAMGGSALSDIGSGSWNVGIGSGNLTHAPNTNENVGIGFHAPHYLTGNQNTYIGTLAGENSGAAFKNILLGYAAGRNIGGLSGVFQVSAYDWGSTALDSVKSLIWGQQDSANLNRVIKLNALDVQFAKRLALPAAQYNSTITDNYITMGGSRWFTSRFDSTFWASNGANTGGSYYIGINAGSVSTNNGGMNIGIGDSALANINNFGSIAIGQKALASTTTGSVNIAIGNGAMRLNQTGGFNTTVGYQSLENNIAGNNTNFGYRGLRANTSGVNNTMFGVQGGIANTTGSYNTGVGYDVMLSNTTGYGNTSVGNFSMRLNTTGSNNTAIGDSALYNNSTGSYNDGFGAFAGFNYTGGLKAFFSNGAKNSSSANDIAVSPMVITKSGVADSKTGNDIKVNGTFTLQSYTVATLPTAGSPGRLVWVTDALTPAFNAVLVGGGTIGTIAADNGTNWTAH